MFSFEKQHACRFAAAAPARTPKCHSSESHDVRDTVSISILIMHQCALFASHNGHDYSIGTNIWYGLRMTSPFHSCTMSTESWFKNWSPLPLLLLLLFGHSLYLPVVVRIMATCSNIAAAMQSTR